MSAVHLTAKILFSVTLSVFCFTATAQENAPKVKIWKPTDSVSPDKSPAYYVNNVKISFGNLSNFNADKIKNIEVLKNNNPAEPNGTIMITLMDSAQFKIITLNELYKKYVDVKAKPALFIVDGIFVTADPDKSRIDENFILSIEVFKSADVPSMKQIPGDYNVVKILSRSKENLEKANSINIRGDRAERE
ncbi:MAG: hypothetical protein EOO92_06395 [Pedobacter sp.]|nr:MAG: hypothetical protein EOO92_06395 [Pedobacter sp.]